MPVLASRRLVLGGLAAAAAMRPPVAPAAEARRHIVVGCWGGAYADAMRRLVDDGPMRDAGIDVTQRAEPEAARVTAMGAQPKAFDVAMLSDVDAYRFSLTQAFHPLTTAGVGALPHVIAALRAPYCVPQGQTALCIVHNPANAAQPPASFASLFAAASATGDVGFSSELAIHNIAAATLSRGRTLSDLEPGRIVFAELKKKGRLRIYPDNEALGKALAAGEIASAPMWRSRAYAWRRRGLAIRDTLPAEGAIPFTVVGCVPNGIARPQDAMLYLNALLQPETQRGMTEAIGLMPTIRNVVIPQATWNEMGFDARQQQNFRALDLAMIARNGPELRRYWDTELA